MEAYKCYCVILRLESTTNFGLRFESVVFKMGIDEGISNGNFGLENNTNVFAHELLPKKEFQGIRKRTFTESRILVCHFISLLLICEQRVPFKSQRHVITVPSDSVWNQIWEFNLF